MVSMVIKNCVVIVDKLASSMVVPKDPRSSQIGSRKIGTIKNTVIKIDVSQILPPKIRIAQVQIIQMTSRQAVRIQQVSA